MIRLLSAELRKVWHSRFFLLAFSVLLGANLFLLWFGTGHTPGNVPSSAYRKLEQQISGMSISLSHIHGIPNGRVEPLGFGMSLRRTGLGL